MSNLRARLLVATVVASSLVAGSAPAATAGGGPLTYRYPSAECPQGPTGLQACVDGAASGDIVLLTAEILDETVAIRRSLTLQPESPTLIPLLRAIFVGDGTDPGTDADIDVHLARMRVERGVGISSLTGTGDRVTIDRLTVGKNSTDAEGIAVNALSPISVEIRRSFIRTLEDQEPALGFYVSAPSGDVSLLAIGNELTAAGSVGSGSGIDLRVQNDVHLDARIYSNVIHDVVQDNAGAASGIVAYLDETATVRLRIVGNTLDGIRSNGIGVRNDLVAPGHLVIDIVGNVVSHADGLGIRLDRQNPGTMTVRNGWNAFWKNDGGLALGGGKVGPGTITKRDPRYVNAGANDFRLRADSPLIDAGQACTPGGLARLDKAGRARWAGRQVDIGAYERGAGASMGEIRMGDGGPDTLVGTAGRDILCGLGGKDRLTGRGGPDLLDGGAANDVLCAKDGSGSDVVLGGPGSDAARRDAGDVISSVESSAAAC
jgi:hypothetical protein